MKKRLEKNISLDYKNIGTEIRKIRQEKCLTQFQLAELADMSTNYLSHIENGLSKLSLQILIQLVNALNTTPNRILYTVISNQKLLTLEEIILSLQNLDATQLEIILNCIDTIKNYKIEKKAYKSCDI